MSVNIYCHFYEFPGQCTPWTKIGYIAFTIILKCAPKMKESITLFCKYFLKYLINDKLIFAGYEQLKLTPQTTRQKELNLLWYNHSLGLYTCTFVGLTVFCSNIEYTLLTNTSFQICFWFSTLMRSSYPRCTWKLCRW